MAENHKLFNNEKINVYEAQDEVAIDVFDVSSSGTKPDGAILVTTGTYVPGAISVNVTNKIPGSLGVKFVGGDSPVPPGPTLPPYTIRLEYEEGETPYFDKGIGTQVSQSPNIWDLTYNDTDWNNLLNYQVSLKNVLGANTTDVTNMDYMFNGCTSLSSIPLFNTTNVTSMENFVGYSHITGFPQLDTSNVVNMNSMFEDCSHIEVIPNLNTNKVQTVDRMFAYCYNITGGILDFYNQLTGQPEPPSSHTQTFYNCGSNTETGAAELEQIPDDWK